MDIEFFQNFQNFCEHFLWGLTPQNAHTEKLRLDRFTVPVPLLLGPNGKKTRKLNAYESVINISSARRALPDNDQTYKVMKKSTTE